jgi:hypothetical protein
VFFAKEPDDRVPARRGIVQPWQVAAGHQLHHDVRHNGARASGILRWRIRFPFTPQEQCG